MIVLFRDGILVTFLQSYLDHEDPVIIIWNEEALLQEYLRHFQKILKKCFLGTKCIVISLECSNFQPHTSVSTVTKGSSLSVFVSVLLLLIPDLRSVISYCYLEHLLKRSGTINRRQLRQCLIVYVLTWKFTEFTKFLCQKYAMRID